MSLFEELAKLFLKVQPPGDEPYQWIYAVDDAWFHPQSSTVLIKDKDTDPLKSCEPVFDFDLVGNENENQIIERNAIGTPVAPVPSPTNDASPLGHSGPMVTPSNISGFSARMREALAKTGTDRDVVGELFRFILDQHDIGNRYGICFCSFEWFWMNILEIDQPQNAVFFDIRHLLGKDGSVITRAGSELDVGQLREDWKTALEEIGLFSKIAQPAHMERLGWHLHYSLKFAKVPNQVGHHSAIAANHIQIVSSAVNPGSGRPDAMSDYSEVQGFIWGKLAPLGGTPVEDITPDRFTFSPMPKDAAMATGLSIFNNSFRHAANWGAIRKQWCKDIKGFYEFRPDGHYHSPQEAVTDAPTRFRWRTWFPNEVKGLVTDPLFLNSRYYNGGACAFSQISIDVLLKLLAHSGVREFPKLWSGFDNRTVTLPSCPGFVFVFLLIDFAHALGPKNGRNAPAIRYTLDDQTSPKKFMITFKLDEAGTTELKHCYDNAKRSNGNAGVGDATKSLWRLMKNAHASSHPVDLPGKETFESLNGLNPITICKDFPEITWLNDRVSISMKAT